MKFANLRVPQLVLILALALGAPSRGQDGSDELKRLREGRFGESRPCPNPFRVLVWNIDRDTEAEAIRRGIEAEHPDFALLQEVDLHTSRTKGRDVPEELGRELAMNYAYASAFEELHQGVGNALAYQGQATLSRAPLASSRVIRFKSETTFWNTPLLPSWFPQRRIGGRIALVSTVAAGQSQVVFYNLHLESRGPGVTRYAQLKEVLADADGAAPKGNIVLAGDLNTKYMASKFTGLLAQHGFQSCFGAKTPRTHRVIGSLDWIFVRGNLRCEAPQVLKQVKGSDHFPLAATIRVLEPTATGAR